MTGAAEASGIAKVLIIGYAAYLPEVLRIPESHARDL